MIARSQQVLTVLLLLLFSLENVAAGIMPTGNEINSSQSRQYVQQGIQTLYPILAEENEERDHKDDAAISYNLTATASFSPMLLLALTAGMKKSNAEVRFNRNTIPRYTAFCSFII